MRDERGPSVQPSLSLPLTLRSLRRSSREGLEAEMTVRRSLMGLLLVAAVAGLGAEASSRRRLG